MKKALLLLPILALSACDRPTSTAELTCDMDKYWKQVNALYLPQYSDNEHQSAKVDVTVTTYDNYATVTFDDITTTFEKVKQEKYYGDFGHIYITYKGHFPGSERTALLGVLGDITNKKILQYNINFVGEKEEIHGREYNINHSCLPVRAEHKGKEWSAAVPFNHKYKMPNKTERCINEILQTVYCISNDKNENCDALTILYNGKMLDLTQKDALSISANWDYKNMKLYQNDGILEEHESDACEVLDRLNKFIHDTGLDSKKNEQYIILERELESYNTGNRIIATGDNGDYLIQISETSALHRFVFDEKNTKFLSIWNPNQYAKEGYCLVNVIPHTAMGKAGLTNKTCKYRIYCGAPESMDYDQDYAVEVCE